MSTIASNEAAGPADQVASYSSLPNKLVRAANSIDYAYRDTGDQEGSKTLVLLRHFRSNLDYWDPALVGALAQSHRVIDDLDAVLAAATAADGTKLLRPLPAPTPGRRLAFVADLDGNVLELIGPVEGSPRE